MMIRSLFVILLMIGLMMPCAWAGVNDAPSPLSKVTIDAEDWVDGDMYHIRYTFTNPTDEMIDEEISLTDITYDLCENKPLNKDITQCSETLSRLTIAPHSSYTTTVSLTPPVPTPFNYLLASTFYFADGSYLRYAPPKQSPKSHFTLLPNISPSGNVTLSIQNNSSNETITELRNIQLFFYIDGQTLHSLSAEPILTEIKPTKKITIPLATLERPIDEKRSTRFYAVLMQINGILHCYTESFASHIPAKSIPNDTVCTPFETKYHFSNIVPSSQDGIYTLDNTFLHLYFPIKNCYYLVNSGSERIYHFDLKYFDHTSHYHKKTIIIRLPKDLCIAPNETKYFSCKIPLPPDFYKLIPTFSPCISTSETLSEPTLFPSSNHSLLVPKEQYITLTNIKIIGL